MRLPASFPGCWLLPGSSAALFALAVACGGTVTKLSDDGSGGSHANTGGAPATGGVGTGGRATGGLTASGGAQAGGCHDSDGDGLSDQAENYDVDFPWDSDGDFLADYLDTDSDNNGILDAEEAGDHEPCSSGPDTDNDGFADFRDPDDDDDRLQDAFEGVHGYNRLEKDSDFNGCTDFEEYTFGECDPANVVLQSVCYTAPGGVGLTLQVSQFIPEELSDISLTVTPVDPELGSVLETYVYSVLPEGAGKIQDGVLSSVGPGAAVYVNIELENGGATNYFKVRIESASQGVIAEGQVLWLVEPCPILK